MAENPLTKLARLVGGVALLPGSLGHQVLGQLLISKSTGVEVAGVNLALAAVSRQTNSLIQVAVGAVVPAVVVEVLSRKEQRRLEGLAKQLAQLQQDLESRSRPERTAAAGHDLNIQQQLQKALIREVLMLRSQNEPRERKIIALQRLLGDESAPAPIAKAPKLRNTKLPDVTSKMKSATDMKALPQRVKPVVKKPSTRTKLAVDSSRKPVTRTKKKQTARPK